MSECNLIRSELKKRNFEVTFDREDDKGCIINFKYSPSFERVKTRFGEDIALAKAISSVAFNKETQKIEANLLSPLEKFCELYLDYCCRDNEWLCRVHIDKEIPARVGLEIKQADIEKLKGALDDFINCTRR